MIALLSLLLLAQSDPEAGKLAAGTYESAYFGLSYPLPQGWEEGLAPPEPSVTGYYVLETPKPAPGERATLLIAAQDEFFASKRGDAMAMAADLRAVAAHTAGLEPEGPPERVTVAGHEFVRLELGGEVLSRIVYAADIRCHVVSFTFAASDRAELKSLAASLEHIAFAPETPPLCVRDYASAETLVHRVEPELTGTNFTRIPVRVIVGTDGKVTHVHVIRGTPEQASAVEAALAQWQFKPRLVDGKPVEIETGLTFEIKPK